MHPDAQDFCQQFSVLQSKVLAKYDDLLLHISNGKPKYLVLLGNLPIFLNFFLFSDFLRTLAIIRLKNPSRGVKRSNNETTKKKNTLDGIVDIVEVRTRLTVITLILIS